jgi:glycosyltransferase involved in cell wall biosynthesis
MGTLIIVEPWFTAAGHPAQSLINTARTIGREADIDYLISIQKNLSVVDSSRKQLKEYGRVTEFKVNSPSLREGTFKALLKLKKMAGQNMHYGHIFFLDAHLVLLALLWPFFFLWLNPKRLSTVYLMGPERILCSKIATWLVGRFIKRNEVTLYLRTEELATAWCEAFSSDFNCRIRHIPSLELPEGEKIPAAPTPANSLKFAVIGQVRRGKGLDWLVPLFENNRALGMLTVAGTFSSEIDRQAIKVLSDFGGFLDKFLTENEMLQQAMQQDYLLMLYDDWDERMESAILYLAARANRPVITYDKGWIGRKVRQFGCGLPVTEEQGSMESFLLAVPRPDSVKYKELLKGLSDFREAHSGEVARKAFLIELAYD